MKKRLISILLALCLLLALPLGALAAEDDTPAAGENAAEAAAQTLHALGLFKGVGDNPDGTPNFDLESVPNRAQAITMLVRLLGKEAEATAGEWETPFTDVPDWAKPYVGYAYVNGLTKGTGDDTFGSYALVSATQYLTFVLRALGYSDGTDFLWNAAWEKTDALGITGGEYSAENNTVNRGDMAVVSADSLRAKCKDGEDTLIETLVERGAVAAEKAKEQGFDVEVPAEPEPGITVTEGDKGLVIAVTNQAGLTQALRQTEKVAEINIAADFTVSEDSGVSYEGDRLDVYRDVAVTVEEGVTLTVVEGGQLGVYWFTFEGDWDNAPTGKLINKGTLVVEKDGWINGDFAENHGTIIVRDGGQCQTLPTYNDGDVTVESGGSYRTTQGDDVTNDGTVLIEEGANMVARFGSSIINNGTITVNGLLSVGYLYMPAREDDPETEEDESMPGMEGLWLKNNGEITGTGTARVYDVFNEESESDRADVMLAMITEELGADTTLTVVTGIGTGV